MKLYEDFARGKLLLSGEYAVLEGAASLAVPLTLGQFMSYSVNQHSKDMIRWDAFDQDSKCWVSFSGNLDDGRVDSDKHALFVTTLLKAVTKLGGNIPHGSSFSTKLNYPLEWGLGSSSTTIAHVARCFSVDPFHLSDLVTGGSGYDVAAAFMPTPFLFTRALKSQPRIEKVDLPEVLMHHSYFVYSGNKQSTREAVTNYQLSKNNPEQFRDAISVLTARILKVTTLQQLNNILSDHENLVGKQLSATPIKIRLFPDYPFMVKSLGAWGGDFFWVTAETKSQVLDYFLPKGYSIIYHFHDLISH